MTRASSTSTLPIPITWRNGSPEPGAPERLPFPREAAPRVYSRIFSSDGRRFLVERYASEAEPEPIRLVHSWRRLVER